jgi:hypothetical protein
MRRAAGEGIVNFTWDPESDGYWLTRDYLPWLREWDASRFPTISQLRSALPRAAAEPIPIPDDCADAFLVAHWARPEAYLDPLVQRSNSAFAHAPDAERLTTGFERLADDLRTGAWDARHRHLRRHRPSTPATHSSAPRPNARRIFQVSHVDSGRRG